MARLRRGHTAVNKRRGAVIALAAMVFALVAGFDARFLRIATDIAEFLPAGSDRELSKLSRDIADSALTRGMVFALSGATESESRAAASQFARLLEGHPNVRSVRRGAGASFGDRFYQTYFPHRLQWLDPATAHDWSDESLTVRANEAVAGLASPAGGMRKSLVREDPLGFFLRFVERLEREASASLRVLDGQFVTADGARAIVFVETVASPFDGARQTPFVADVETLFAAVNAQHGGRVRLEQSGINRFAVDAERKVRADVERISFWSTVAITGIFLLLFRSVRVLIAAAIPLLFGCAFGTAATLAVFGCVHALTLAFGATILGVCVDFPIHFLNEHALDPESRSSVGTMTRIRAPLVLGASTTIAGFAALGWTGVPGITEMAVYSSVGVLASLLATVLVLPAIMPDTSIAVPAHERVADWAGRGVYAALSRPLWRWGVPSLALLVCALGLPKIHWIDDLSTVIRVDAKMLEEDERVRGYVSSVDSGRFVLAAGPTDEEALQANERAVAALERARSSGALARVDSVHPFLRSVSAQHASWQALHADASLVERAETAFRTAGFREGMSHALERSLAEAEPAPLRFGDLDEPELEALVRPYRVLIGDRIGYLSFVSGVKDIESVESALRGLPGVTWFDQSAFLARAYARYRSRTGEVLAAGLLVVFLTLFSKYRRIRKSLAALLPSVLSAMTTLAIFGLVGVQVHLLHLVALVLVLSSGEDYAVFLLEAAEPKHLRHAALSIALCCASTVLGFGLLAFSQVPVLQALGMTTGTGIMLSLLLAPTARSLGSTEVES